MLVVFGNNGKSYNGVQNVYLYIREGSMFILDFGFANLKPIFTANRLNPLFRTRNKYLMGILIQELSFIDTRKSIC